MEDFEIFNIKRFSSRKTDIDIWNQHKTVVSNCLDVIKNYFLSKFDP